MESSPKMTVVNAQLIVVGAPDESIPDAIELQRLPLRFGRSKENDVQLSHPLVSRVHCELYADGGRLFVKDLNSLNGTFVGKHRVTESELRCGDLLTVGAVTFRAVFGDFDVDRAPGEANDDENILDTVPLASSAAEETRTGRRPRGLPEEEPTIGLKGQPASEE